MVLLKLPLKFSNVETNQQNVHQYVEFEVDLSKKDILNVCQTIGRFYGANNIEYDSISLTSKIKDMLAFIENNITQMEDSKKFGQLNLKDLLHNLTSLSHFAHYTPILRQILKDIVIDNDCPNIEYIAMNCSKCRKFIKQRSGDNIQRIGLGCETCQIVYIQENFNILVNVMENGWGHFAFALHAMIISLFVIFHAVNQDINDDQSLMRKLVFHWILSICKNILSDVTSVKYWNTNCKKISKYMTKFGKVLETCKLNCNPKMFVQFTNTKCAHPVAGVLKQSIIDICGRNNTKRQNFDELANLLFSGFFLRLLLESWKIVHKANYDCKDMEIYLFMCKLNITEAKRNKLCNELNEIRNFLIEQSSTNFLLEEKALSNFLLKNHITEIFTCLIGVKDNNNVRLV
ncbi:P45 [Neodiprion sertifer nucleopolyhedrovirus]|uniref:p45 n=1 Tax=Neodiprion sertifer nucleopolyhedrovirus TaxID=111874 RepID=Q6JKC7_9CBAC|nr:P45 [Neodiprion sertifer nucleopolyhedrovirus]AAQ96410.1 P45 [Neodiprion sertifer nucleopolyhedrovirus]